VTSPLLEIEPRVRITESIRDERRKQMDADVWLFIRIVTDHGETYVERFHRPMAYIVRGDGLRLAACLARAAADKRWESQVTIDLATELRRRKIDWWTQRGVRKLTKALARVNERITRGFGKTSIGMDVVLGTCSADPNLSVGIASKSDPAVHDKMLPTIGATMLTDRYAMYYGDRLHKKNPESKITKKYIDMAGRKPSDEHSIFGQGIKSPWTGHHFDWIYPDDIVGSESGEASTADALAFISILTFISKQHGQGGSRHIFHGTVYGPKDDNSVLVRDKTFLSLNIPKWKKSVPHTMANIMVNGIPTLPEWAPLEAIIAERAQVISNPKEGKISWLRNAELSADEVGASKFTPDLLARSKFVWKERTFAIGNKIVTKRMIRRYLWTDGAPRRAQNLKEPCMCWMNCGLTDHAYKEFDRFELPRMMAVDQGYTPQGGDPWAIACGAQDPDGVVYLLRGETGNGYNYMIPMIPAVFKRLGGAANPPRNVGVESNSWQRYTADWLKRDNDFRFLANRVTKLKPGQTEKMLRIYEHIYGNLMLGTVMIDPDPEYAYFDAEAIGYSPESTKDPEDSNLDAAAMVVQMFGQPEQIYSDSDRTLDEIRAQQAYFETHDAYGVDLTDWVSQVM
jgi:hypothetical protein